MISHHFDYMLYIYIYIYIYNIDWLDWCTYVQNIDFQGGLKINEK